MLFSCMAIGSDVSIKRGVPLYKQLICLRIHYACPVKCPHFAANAHFGALETRKFSNIWELHSSLTFEH